MRPAEAARPRRTSGPRGSLAARRTPRYGGGVSTLQAKAIGTKRLELLPLRTEHAEEMAEVLRDPALHTFTGGAPGTPEALRSRYQRLTAGSPDPAVSWLNWVIRLRDGACLTGTVQATVGHRGPGPAAEIAWVVGTPWQGRGIATEAARALVDWLGLQRVHAVVAHVHPRHRASAAVAAAAGLSPTDSWHEGEIRWHRSLHRDDAAGPGGSSRPAPRNSAATAVESRRDGAAGDRRTE